MSQARLIPDDVAAQLVGHHQWEDTVEVPDLGTLTWCGKRCFIDRHWTVWRRLGALELWAIEEPHEPGKAELFRVVARNRKINTAYYTREGEDDDH